MTAAQEKAGVLAVLLRAELKVMRPTPYNAIQLAKEIAEARATFAELMKAVEFARPLLTKYLADYGEQLQAAGIAGNAEKLVDRLDVALARATGGE